MAEVFGVSIHAPRAGRDNPNILLACDCICFNPRAPCGARLGDNLKRCRQSEFQSTRPVRGATVTPGESLAELIVSIHAPRAGRDRADGDGTHGIGRFNPRAPCGARPPLLRLVLIPSLVSIHAPRAGRDQALKHWLYQKSLFQSTRPVRGATLDSWHLAQDFKVSIHAPRAGRDVLHVSLSTRPPRFNPRAPCGARPGHYC